MGDLLVIGTGGHAKAVIGLALASGWSIAGCVGCEPAVDRVLDFPILGGDADLPQLLQRGLTQAVVAIGDNRIRSRVGGELAALGFELPALVSPRATIGYHVTLGAGTVVMPGVVINPATSVGRFVILNTTASIDHDVTIGDYAHIAPNGTLCGGVAVGVGTFVGAGAVVAPNITVGEWAVVGAGATVLRPVPPGATFIGVPARLR